MNIYYVYFYLRKDFSPYYVGKGKNDRAYYKNNNEIKPPKDKSKIILVEQNLTELQAFILERYYIRWFGRKDLGTGILRNKSEGGYGGSCGPEGRIKISKNKKDWWTEERKKKQSEKVRTEENPFYRNGRSEKSNISRSVSCKKWWTEERKKRKKFQNDWNNQTRHFYKNSWRKQPHV